MATLDLESLKRRINKIGGGIGTSDLPLYRQYLRRIVLDLVVVAVGFSLGWFVRFDGQVPAAEWRALGRSIGPIACLFTTINLALGLHRRLWAYASFRDAVLLATAACLGTGILIAVNAGLSIFGLPDLPVGGLVIGALFTVVLSVATKYRLQLRAIFLTPPVQPDDEAPERVLIVGVNELAQQVATRIYLGTTEAKYEVVGFVVDEPKRQGMSVNGVEIVGTPSEIPTLVRERGVDVIIIANGVTDQESMWALMSLCQETSAQVKVLPDLMEVIEGRYRDPLAIRDLTGEDILDRDPVTVDSEACSRVLENKVVLVTGAAGSIGSELCRQILRLNPRSVVALDNNETGLYELNLELSQEEQSALHLVIGDVSDWNAMRRAFEQHRPDVVFHAAAYKHVPLVEAHPEEAVRVNVLGTVIVSELAHQQEAERFVFISTDKAVEPCNVMGASKRIGELWMEAMSRRSATLFTTVRFGNVLGSRGSVIPTFSWQLASGGPLTVTHPEMHRYFLSIPEAVTLVLQSAAFSQDGDTFMLEMGDEVSILRLAQRMIRLKGLRVDKDVEIEFMGMRPGEKLHEELAYRDEQKEETPHPRIYSLRSPCEPMDHDVLLGAVLILSQTVRVPELRSSVSEGIFQVASRDVDAFLNEVTGVDLTRDWRQLTDGKGMDQGGNGSGRYRSEEAAQCVDLIPADTGATVETRSSS